LPRELLGIGSEIRPLGRVRYPGVGRFAAASRQFASKLAPTPSGQRRDGAQPWISDSGRVAESLGLDSGRRAEAGLRRGRCGWPFVGAGLPRELPGTGSKIRRLGRVRYPALAGFAAASRQFASKLAPTPSGQRRGGAQPWISDSGRVAESLTFLFLAESWGAERLLIQVQSQNQRINSTS
jgi:hypothetical protein